MSRRELIMIAGLASFAVPACLRDFTLPPRREGGAVDRVAAEARDRDGKDRSSDVPATDLVTPPDQGCPSPCVTTFAGTNQAGLIDGPLSQARFKRPASIAPHGSGALVVADSDADVIRRIAGGQVTTFAGTGGWGYKDGPASAAAFQTPHEIASDGTAVYVTEHQRVRQISGGLVTTFAGGLEHGDLDGPALSARFYNPAGLAWDGALGLLLADSNNHRIRRVQNGQVSTLAGSVSGYLDGPVATAQLNLPLDVAVDSSGAIHVSDRFNNCIRRIAGGQVTTFAGSCGPRGLLDGPAALAKFDEPRGIAIDAQGAVLVADTGNSRIRRIASGVVSTLAGSVAGYQDGPAATARFAKPSDVTVDASGAIYVADTDNYCIRRIQ